MRTVTLLAVPLTAAMPPLADQARSAKAAGGDLIELRLDLIDDVPAVRALLGQPRELPIILTVRSAAEGGHSHASDAGRATLFEQLASLRPDYIDLEFQAWRRSPELRSVVQRFCRRPSGSALCERPQGRAAPGLILSRHDLHATPADLAEALQPLLTSPAEVVKAVFTPRDALDACRVLSQLQQLSRQRKLIMLATRPAGLITRVLARKFNAFLTFAALEAGRESAPGQPVLDELVNVYRWREIDSATSIFGVVGWPVSHSQSPRIHNAAMRAAGINGVYVPLPVRPTYEGFAGFMDYVAQHPHLGFRGLSVTIPHKRHASRWLAERGFPLSETARQAGATNTLTHAAPADWTGDNTDVAGFLAVLATIPDADRSAAAVLGAGGVARAAVCALLLRGYAVNVFNRTATRAERLVADLGGAALPWEERLRMPSRLIVNCTSLGMSPEIDSTPMPADALPAGPSATVIDAVYTPASTRLLREARERGCHTISGTELFLAQAAAQFEGWHGRPAGVELMRRCVMRGKE